MGRNPHTDPQHYASPQQLVGPPATYTSAQSALVSYDYGR